VTSDVLLADRGRGQENQFPGKRIDISQSSNSLLL